MSFERGMNIRSPASVLRAGCDGTSCAEDRNRFPPYNPRTVPTGHPVADRLTTTANVGTAP